MARRIQVLIEDDLAGGPNAETVAFVLDGRAFEIDLSAENAHALRDALAPWVAAARTAGATPVIDLRATGSRRSVDAAAIRAWALAQRPPGQCPGADLPGAAGPLRGRALIGRAGVRRGPQPRR